MRYEFPFGDKGVAKSENDIAILIQRKGYRGLPLAREEAEGLRDALSKWLAAGEEPRSWADRVQDAAYEIQHSTDSDRLGAGDCDDAYNAISFAERWAGKLRSMGL